MFLIASTRSSLKPHRGVGACPVLLNVRNSSDDILTHVIFSTAFSIAERAADFDCTVIPRCVFNLSNPILYVNFVDWYIR